MECVEDRRERDELINRPIMEPRICTERDMSWGGDFIEKGRTQRVYLNRGKLKKEQVKAVAVRREVSVEKVDGVC